MWRKTRLFHSTPKVYILCINKEGMDMESKVTKWGNSLGVRIPRTLAEKVGLTEGTPIIFDAGEDAIVIRRKRHSLEALLAQVTPENLHGEVNTGRPVGREVW